MSPVNTGSLFPPRGYKNAEELSLPENERLRHADIDSLTVIHEKVHASVEGSKIVEFFDGKSIFLTGGTGFIGKLITEKLLRTCRGIENFYVLVRRKKGLDEEARLDATFENEIFSELRKAQPKFRHKVVPIKGDVSLPGLGISIEDREKLVENVNVIIHGAATVKFDEKLRLAVSINVFGTKEVMSLAQQCKHLVSLVHISTAYSNCIHKEIKEEFYDSGILTEPILKIVETHSEKYLEKNEKVILRGWPNTYTFTKAVAEHTVRSMANDIPISICRPSIVTSTYREPLKSWIDNFYGPMGAVVGCGTGILKTFNADPEKVADLIPGDFVSNTVIAAAYQNQFNKKGEIKIYNTVSSAENPITWGDFTNLIVHYGFQNPPMKAVWYYSNTVNKSKFIHYLYTFFLHIIPALLVDGCMIALGKKRRLLSIYQKVLKFNEILSYFSLKEWRIRNENSQQLWNDLSDKDKELFQFSASPTNFDWNSYMSILGGGVRLYLLKDKMETIPEARKKYRRLYYVHQTFRIVSLLIGLKILMSILNAIITIFTTN